MVLADELTTGLSGRADLPAALRGFMTRRDDRRKYLCNASESICWAEIARSTTLDRPGIVKGMLMKTAEPI